jgi:hypothetical protein
VLSHKRYEIPSTLLPQIKHIDQRFRAELDARETETPDINHLPRLLGRYKNLHMSVEYSGFLPLPDGDGTPVPVIPCVVGVDAMAIERYSEKTNRLLLLNRPGVSIESVQLRE